jgi:hypothetical protein
MHPTFLKIFSRNCGKDFDIGFPTFYKFMEHGVGGSIKKSKKSLNYIQRHKKKIKRIKRVTN